MFEDKTLRNLAIYAATLPALSCSIEVTEEKTRHFTEISGTSHEKAKAYELHHPDHLEDDLSLLSQETCREVMVSFVMRNPTFAGLLQEEKHFAFLGPRKKGECTPNSK